jgi:hypothetical protein
MTCLNSAETRIILSLALPAGVVVWREVDSKRLQFEQESAPEKGPPIIDVTRRLAVQTGPDAW